MQHLGFTRSSYQGDHLLHTPDSFIRAPLPGMKNGTAIIHTGPAGGAQFMQYTAELEPSGELGATEAQRFLFVIEGEITVGAHRLPAGKFAYLPEEDNTPVAASTKSRIAVIEKPYLPLDCAASPAPIFGDANTIEPKSLLGDPSIEIRGLIPDDPAFDMAVNTMTFQPGAALPMVEIHIMEHGLLILEGGGIYRLSDNWYSVSAGDFIYMAPYCPQWFGAIGKTAAKYLIYKDWNRHPLA